MTSPGRTQRPRFSTRATSAHFACRQGPTNVTLNLREPARITTVMSSSCDQLDICRAKRHGFSLASGGAGGVSPATTTLAEAAQASDAMHLAIPLKGRTPENG